MAKQDQDANYWKQKFQKSDAQIAELQGEIGRLNQQLASERERHREELKRAQRATVDGDG